MQKRHSFTVDDIVWNELFVPMVSEGPNGECIVDYNLLHSTRPLSEMDEDDIEPVASIL